MVVELCDLNIIQVFYIESIFIDIYLVSKVDSLLNGSVRFSVLLRNYLELKMLQIILCHRASVEIYPVSGVVIDISL